MRCICFRILKLSNWKTNGEEFLLLLCWICHGLVNAIEFLINFVLLVYSYNGNFMGYANFNFNFQWFTNRKTLWQSPRSRDTARSSYLWSVLTIFHRHPWQWTAVHGHDAAGDAVRWHCCQRTAVHRDHVAGDAVRWDASSATSYVCNFLLITKWVLWVIVRLRVEEVSNWQSSPILCRLVIAHSCSKENEHKQIRTL